MAQALSLTLPPRKVIKLLQHFETQFGQVFLESIREVDFRAIGREPNPLSFSDPDFSLEHWQHGRAFGASLEARWRPKKQGKYAALLVGDEPPELPPHLLTAEDEPPLVLELKRADDSLLCYLWGEWQNPNVEELPNNEHHYWYELRIPRWLPYPYAQRAERLQLQVVMYTPKDATTQTDAVIYRFVGLKPA